MDSDALNNIIHLAQAFVASGHEDDLHDFLTNKDLSDDEQKYILNVVLPSKITVIDNGLGVGEGVDTSWVDRMQPQDWRIWNNHFNYLAYTLKRKHDITQSISEQSECILRRLPDPLRPSFKGKGLVVGYVQSGKTANFTAVAARAIDAGYKLIIVLSGIHNNLRAQTQRRLERELTGHLDPNIPQIQRPESGKGWIHLTSLGDDEDFRQNHDISVLEGQQPILAVTKKNCTILENLLSWIQSSSEEHLAECPTLIIDDEADQASVNTGQDRQEEEEDENISPSKTNALIRKIVAALPKVAYLAYTATPFANILISPDSTDIESGQDLFPSDFIWQLPRPSGYTGTAELFGNIDHESRDVIRIIPREELPCIKPPSPKTRDEWFPEICNSLKDAINEFILAAAVRMHRDYRQKHHTMLVHTTHYTECQEKLTQTISNYVNGLTGNITYDNSYMESLRSTWSLEFQQSLDGPNDLLFDDLEPHIRSFLIDKIPVLQLNSASDDTLDFTDEDNNPIKAICVGGNRLSRGLTLEGLTVSIFVRTTTMADTLLQMARWYGFRIGYEDLIRIYTTDEISDWFADLALVEDDLRAEIERLRSSGLTPMDIGIKLKSHSALRLTSTAKSQNAVIHRESWSGQHPQNILLPVQDEVALQSDYDQTILFIDKLKFLKSGTGYNAATHPQAILDYLSQMSNPIDSKTFDLRSICNWIEEQTIKGHLNNWAVHIPNNERQSANILNIRELNVGLAVRSRLKNSNTIGVLIDQRHEAADLDLPYVNFRNSKGRYESLDMRRYRAPDQALLMIYLIDPTSDSNTKGRTRLIPGEVNPPPAIIGLAFSFPFIPDDDGKNIIMNEYFTNE